MSQPPTVVCIQRKGGVIVKDCDVYIGRACNMGGWRLPQSIWHNPFSVSQYGLDEALIRYREYLQKRPDLIALLPTLEGKVLGCWCKKPGKLEAPCHGDILVELCQEALDSQDSQKL